MSEFLDKLKAAAGEPGGSRPKTAARIYVESHYEEILKAKKQGYTYAQLAAFILEEAGKPLGPKNLTLMLAQISRTRSPLGRAFAYTLDGSARVFKKFVPGGDGEAINAAAEEIIQRTGKRVFIVAEKPKKWQPEDV